MLGQGTDGCSFGPPLPCASGTTPEGIGKVFKFAWGAEAEAEIARTVDRVDPRHRVTPALRGRCRVARERVPPACTVLGGLVPLPAAPTQLVYDRAGDVDLAKLVGPDAPPLPWKARAALIRAFRDVLEAVERLQAKRYAHLDLHPGNVVVDRTRDPWRMKVIDFGWSRPLRDVKVPWHGLRARLLNRTPFTDGSPLAARACAPFEPVAPSPARSRAVEARGVDLFAAGCLLWAIVTHPGPLPSRKSRLLEEAAAAAAGLTHPDAGLRHSARDARLRMELQNKERP